MVGKMKKVAVMAVSLFVFASCGSSSKSNSQASYAPASAPSVAYDSGYEVEEEFYEGEASELEIPQKKVKTGSVEMETADVDYTVNSLVTEIANLGGYTQSKKIDTYGKHKSGYATFKIPAENYETALSLVYQYGNVIDIYDSVENLTAAYSDIRTMLEVKRTEEQRLQEFVEQSDSVEDIIKLEQRLSEVKTDIWLYEKRLSDIDRQVAYSTLHINMSENADLNGFKPISADLGSRMSSAFKGSAKGIASFGESFVLNFVKLSIPLAIVAIGVTIGVCINRRKK
ncbi:DUF4349 domain-containing protein [Tyzzerella sp. OttesenSCG-928-J15]|nr:DUF4349 domain-containing protein [Tyzzerella sp. OttesenSCG-928-J15]